MLLPLIVHLHLRGGQPLGHPVHIHPGCGGVDIHLGEAGISRQLLGVHPAFLVHTDQGDLEGGSEALQLRRQFISLLLYVSLGEDGQDGRGLALQEGDQVAGQEPSS